MSPLGSAVAEVLRSAFARVACLPESERAELLEIAERSIAALKHDPVARSWPPTEPAPTEPPTEGAA